MGTILIILTVVIYTAILIYVGLKSYDIGYTEGRNYKKFENDLEYYYKKETVTKRNKENVDELGES